MKTDELNVYYKFEEKDLLVTIVNNTNSDIEILKIELIRYGTEEVIDEMTDIIVEANNVIEDHIFENVPKILEDENLKHTEPIIVRAITAQKSYENDKIQYRRSFSEYVKKL